MRWLAAAVFLCCLAVLPAGRAQAAPGDAASPTVGPTVFKLAFIGIRDEHEGRTDAHNLELSVLHAARDWAGFDVAGPDQVALAITETERILLLTSADQTQAIVRARSNLTTDFVLIGSVRLDAGREMVHLRLLQLPDAMEYWNGEESVEKLDELLRTARIQLYWQANQAIPMPMAVVAHTQPAAVVAGAPVVLEANLLAQRMYPVDLYYRFAAAGDMAIESPWASVNIKFDPAKGVYRGVLPAFHEGRLQYYFWVGDENLNKLGQAGSELSPFEVNVVAPAPKPAVAQAAPVPPVTTSAHRISTPTKLVLGAAGATLVAGLAMGFASHVLHVGDVTEVQAFNAHSYKAPTYILLSLSGALAIAGGTLLTFDLLRHDPAATGGTAH